MNQVPIINLVITGDFHVGKEIRIDASKSYDPDGSIRETIFQFGDGESYNGRKPISVNYIYKIPGNYDVTVILKDNKQAVASKTVRIAILKIGTTIPPSPSNPPLTVPSQSVSVNSSNGNPVPVTYPPPILPTDGVPPYSGPNYTIPNGSSFPVGVTVVGVSYTDSTGNSGIGTLTVTVVDTTPPPNPIPPFPIPPGTHPGIWLDPITLSLLNSKKNSNDSDYLAVKASADSLLSTSMPSFTIVSATNANPVVFTMTEDVPWASGTFQVFIGGGTGNWSGINNVDYPGITATKLTAKTFSIPVNSTSFGSFSGQVLGFFPYDNGDDAGILYAYQGLGWSEAIQDLGIIYRITGTTSYATKGVQLLRYIIKLGKAGVTYPVSADSYFATRGVLLALGLGYDWFFDQLTDQDKLDAFSALNFWYDQTKVNALDINGPTSSNYFTGHILGLGISSLAMVENPRATELVSFVRGKIDNVILPSFNIGGECEGGFPFESYGYGTNSFERCLWAMFAFKSSLGIDLYSSISKKLSKSLIHNLKQNMWQVPDEGDWPGNYVGILNLSFPITLAYAARGFTESGYMQYLYQNAGTPPGGLGAGNPSFVKLLWYDSARTATNYKTLETPIYNSSGDNHLTWRSGWGLDNVWMQFNGATANQGGHQARAFGNIEIQRGNDYFSPYAGQWKGATGLVEDGISAVFSLTGCYASTLFHADGGIYNFTGDAYVGGLGYWGINTVIKREINGSNGHGYMQSDMTSGYYINTGPSGRTLTSFIRSVVFCGSGISVVFDRIIRGSSSYTDKFRSHFNQQASVAVVGSQVNVTLGSSKLTEKYLLPSSLSITSTRDSVNTDDSGTQTTKRIDVTDSAPATTMLHMKAVRVAISSDPDPTISLITATGIYGAYVTDGSDKEVVIFSSDNSILSSISYTEP